MIIYDFDEVLRKAKTQYAMLKDINEARPEYEDDIKLLESLLFTDITKDNIERLVIYLEENDYQDAHTEIKRIYEL